MSFLEGFITAFQGLLAHKLRSFLTILGIIFGVAAVIAMMSIGAGAEKQTLAQIEAFGAKNITVKSKKLLKIPLRNAKRKNSIGLCMSDVKHILKICPSIIGAAPQIIINKQVKFGKIEPKCNIVGINENFRKIMNTTAELGRLINNDDIINYRKVCILGSNVYKTIFHNDDPLGKIIKIGGLRFIIIGTMPDPAIHSSSATSTKINLNTRNIADDIYIPLSVAKNKFSVIAPSNGWSDSEKDPTYNEISELIFQVNNINDLISTKLIIEKVLKRRHKNTDDFEIIIPLEKLKQSQQTQKIFNFVMTGISSLSLLVGGIGIMNIMLATVTERTKEIGIRRAIGAQRNDILTQFLIEASFLSMVGGIIGIIIGVVISYFIAEQAGWQTIVTFYSVFISFTVSVLTGIIFGFWPALRAADLDPITCLRYE